MVSPRASAKSSWVKLQWLAGPCLCEALHVLPVLSRYPSILPQSKDKHVRLICDPMLAVGVNVSINGSVPEF